MPLFTLEQLERLCENGKPENHGKDHFPVAKLVLPGTGCAWLLTEIVPGLNQLYGYGIADYGTGAIHEGYINLVALEQLSDPLNVHGVQPDQDFTPRHNISVYLTAAKMCGYITEDTDRLREACRAFGPVACSPIYRALTRSNLTPQ